jgi:hypothetical protein
MSGTPGRQPPESAGLRAVQARAGGLGAAALSPRQANVPSGNRARFSVAEGLVT